VAANIFHREEPCKEEAMNRLEPKNTSQVVRDTFFDIALYLEAVFFLHGVNDILAEDIIHCMEEGYEKAIKSLKKLDGKKPRIKRKTVVERFIKKLEQEKI
jgi:hypothetical protein